MWYQFGIFSEQKMFISEKIVRSWYSLGGKKKFIIIIIMIIQKKYLRRTIKDKTL